MCGLAIVRGLHHTPPVDEPAPADNTLRQDVEQAETSRRLSGKEAARQDPSAPKVKGYVLVERLGAGAYGEVWKAWQERTGKWVALKLFPRRHGVDWLLLQREVERLIKLDKHPNVVSLLDADLTGDPPYYAMEYMEGGSLESFVDPARRATPEQAAAWAEQIAQALAYVHGKGILHCDLKPANVLLDEEGRVRVADFGQSRIASESTGALGTLYYMSPEQALTFKQNDQLYPDVRWDIFGLGATLYSVLTGRPPHQDNLKDRLEAAQGLDARLREYRDGILAAPAPDCGGAADEDLAAIARHCLEPWPEKRYGSAADLLRDLAARREDLPVAPLAADRAYRARKFIRRNAAVLVACAVAGAALSTAYAALAAQRRALRAQLAGVYSARAREAAEVGDDGAAALLYAQANATHPSKAAARSALSHLDALAVPRRAWDLEGPVETVAVDRDAGRILALGKTGVFLLDGATGGVVSRLVGDEGAWASAVKGRELPKPLEPPKAASPGMVIGKLIMPVGAAVIHTFGGGGLPELAAGFSPDGKRAFTRAGYNTMLLIDPATGRKLAELAADKAAFSPDGRFIASTGQHDSSVRFWDAQTGAAVGSPMRHSATAKSWETPYFEFSADGKLLVTCANESAQFWEVPTGSPAGQALRRPRDNMGRFWINPIGLPERAHISPEGKTVLVLASGNVVVFSRRTGKPVGKPFRTDGNIAHVAFWDWRGANLPQLVLTVTEEGLLQTWPTPMGTTMEAGIGSATNILGTHGSRVNAFALAPGRDLAATGGADGAAVLWSRPFQAAGSFAKRMLHAGPIDALSFSADGKSLVTGGRDGTIRVWDVPKSPVGRAYRWGWSERLSPDGTRAFFCETQRGATFLDLGSGIEIPLDMPRRVEACDRNGIAGARFDKDGRFFATWNQKGEVDVWDAATGKRLAGPLKMADPRFTSPAAGGDWPDWPGRNRLITRSPDGRRLATTDEGMKTVVLRDASGGAVGRPIEHGGRVSALAFSPSSGLLVTAGSDGEGHVVDARTGHLLGQPIERAGAVTAVAISPDDTVVATGAQDGVIRLWDARTGERLGRGLSQGFVEQLAFSRDGGRLYGVGAGLHGWDVSWLSAHSSPEKLLSAVRSRSQRRLNRQDVIEDIPFGAWDRGAASP